MRLKAAAVAASCAGVVLVTGCGGGGQSADQKAVKKVVDDLGAAARASNATKICRDLFTLNLQISVRRAARTSCAQEVGANIFSPDTRFSVGAVTVKGGAATAKVTDQKGRKSTLVFQKQGSQWRIAAIR